MEGNVDLFSESSTIERFRDYLRIPTFYPNKLNWKCVQLLKSYCQKLDFEFDIVEFVTDYPILYVRVEGKKNNLTSLLLNSHYDVVPAYEKFWSFPPFAAEMDAHGNIYARGTQDMKSVGLQYLEALARLKSSGTFKPDRTVYIVFVPDEETSGQYGMARLYKSDLLKSWNVGFVLDEGLANPSEAFLVFNGERSIRLLKIFFTGNAGHASRFVENTCGEKISKFLGILYEYRGRQESQLKNGGACISLGEVSTCNLTMAEGGVSYNVVPAEFQLTVDFRLATDVEISEFEQMLDNWMAACGPGVSWQYCHPEGVMKEHSKTELDKEANPFWKAFLDACDELNIQTQVRIFPASVDSRYLRLMGYDCIGFSPINNTPTLLHDHDEFLNLEVYLRGIQIYQTLIAFLTSC